MDKKRSILNVAVAIIFRIAILITDILIRRFLIQYIGNAVNGLNSLYISILNFLSVAELGVGSAITFCMYRPIVEGNDEKVSALYRLFTKLYLGIGLIILIVGCALMPLLPFLAKDYQSINVNLYLTFGLMLMSVALTYVFSAKISLINAYKNNYLTTIIQSVGQLLQSGAQIVVIVCTKSFVWFIFCRIIAVLFQWGATELIARRNYHKIICNKQKIDYSTKRDVTKNIKAMFMHKIGGVLVTTIDSMVISAFIGIIVLGKYSNYTAIMSAMTGLLVLCFTSLTSVAGHMYVEESKETVEKYFNFFHVCNFIVGLIFFLGYYAVIDNLVTLLFGLDLELTKSISFVITVDNFIRFMRQSVLLFRDATGTFYYDRWKSLFEGLANVVLSILLAYWFGIVGVLCATIAINLFICHIIEPHVYYKYALCKSAKKYYVKNYIYIILFIGLLFVLHFSMIQNDNQWVELFANGAISLAYSLTVSTVVVLINKDFRHYAKNFLRRLKLHKNKQPQTVVATSGVYAEQIFEDVNVSNENSSINEDVNINISVDSFTVEDSDDTDET